MKTHHALGGLAAVVILSASCGGGGSDSAAAPTYPTGTTSGTPAAPAANEVIATSGGAFNPAALTVSKGTTVTFTFQGVEHNVAFDAVTGAPAAIGATSNAAVQRLFATAGAFGFQCTIHPGMRGTVTAN